MDVEFVAKESAVQTSIMHKLSVKNLKFFTLKRFSFHSFLKINKKIWFEIKSEHQRCLCINQCSIKCKFLWKTVTLWTYSWMEMLGTNLFILFPPTKDTSLAVLQLTGSLAFHAVFVVIFTASVSGQRRKSKLRKIPYIRGSQIGETQQGLG